MPPLNRPNAPHRLPIDELESTSFREWAIRRSEGRAPDGPSAASATPLQSPGLVSPTSVSSQRRSKRADRQGRQSESSAGKSSLSREVMGSTQALEYIAPAVTQERPSRLKNWGSIDSMVSDRSSSQSSTSSRTRRFLATPNLRIAEDATRDGQPPGEARRGFNWKHETSGHWLELRIGKKKPSDLRSQASSEDIKPTESEAMTPLSQATTKVPIVEHDAPSFISTAVDDQSISAAEETSGGERIPNPHPKEGLYCRTKRAIGLKRDLSDPTSSASPSRTAAVDMLERTSSVLRLFAERGIMSPSPATTVSDLSIAAHYQPNLRTRNRYFHHNYSTSSSVRSLLMGKPPPGTPESQDMYTGTDAIGYQHVEISEPDAPSFLPSEARRIKTPPLSKDGPKRGGIRGFFFDYNAPAESNTPSPTESGGHTPTVGRIERRVSETEWYRVKLEAIEAEVSSREQYVLAVPEHLPNSPLCPRHPKHKSRGTGVCIYHGQNNSSISSQETRAPSPSWRPSSPPWP